MSAPSAQMSGRYRLLSLLATGGMGEVFLASLKGPENFRKTVVVKRLLRHLAADQSFVDMFLNEARVTALLQHPNIVQVFDLGQSDGTWFIAMEYVPGKSLRACIEKGTRLGLAFAEPLAAYLVAQVLRGLDYAHQLRDESGMPLRILHRDVSPENVLISCAGVAKVLDFGLAKALHAAAAAQTGQLKGKFAYMAPEQLAPNQPLDARLDVYAASVLLHELVANARPACMPQTAADVGPSREPYAVNPALSDGLNTLLLKGLAPAPADRYASAEEMAEALDRFIQQSGLWVTPRTVCAHLEALFGPEVTWQMQTEAMRSASLSHGTAVLAAGLVPLDPGSVVRPTAMLEPYVDGPGVLRKRALWLGGGALAVLAVLLLVLLWPSSREAAAEVAAPADAGRLMPVVALPAADAGALAAEANAGGGRDAGAEMAERVPVPPPPRPARLGVVGPAGSEVWVNGKRIGALPHAPFVIAPGATEVLVKHPKTRFQKSGRVIAEPGKTVMFKVEPPRPVRR